MSLTHLLAWGTQTLRSQGHIIEQAPEIVVQTPWSTVIRFSTIEHCFYVKQTPPDLFIEAQIMRMIQKNAPDALIPTILLENPDLYCFLMPACGDYSLRTKFNGIIDPDLLTQGLHRYLKILRSFEHNVSVLEIIDIPDWRLNVIPQRYIELLQNKALLIEEGLTHDEIDKLKTLVPTIESICTSLTRQKVKETLVNGDFNENNLIFNEKTQQISIVDWGECVITHPFFSIASHLQSLARRYQLDLDGNFLQKIKQQCLSCWLDVADIHELELIYQNILKVHPVFCALAICRLQAATNNKSKTMQNWFVSPFLKKLLLKQ